MNSAESLPGSGIAARAAIFRPVRAGNAFEGTVGRLLQAIRLGIVPPGVALPAERELALRLSVSRDTVREAIKAMADAGFLVSRRGRYGGTFVADASAQSVHNREVAGIVSSAPATAAEIEDILAVREILEIGAARSVARRVLEPAERELLWNRLTDTASASLQDYRRLDSRLHLTIGELVGAPSLVPLIADNRTSVNELLDRGALLQPNLESSNRQHEQIVVAILTGDVEAAATAMLEHLERSAALLRGFLD